MLQKNAKLYGPMNALNTENSSNCWNSEGTGQSSSKTCWFLVDFNRPVVPTQLRVQFQAGFCAETCRVYSKSEDGWELLDDTVEWEDSHHLQSHTLPKQVETTAIRLVLEDPTDFYERVTIYRLEVRGKER